MLYFEARDLASKGSRVDHNTTVKLTGNKVVIKLYDTAILTFHKDGRLTLNSGGYRTATTKRRINQFLPKDLSVKTFKGQWWVCYRSVRKDSKVSKFTDGMVIDHTGNCVRKGEAYMEVEPGELNVVCPHGIAGIDQSLRWLWSR